MNWIVYLLLFKIIYKDISPFNTKYNSSVSVSAANIYSSGVYYLSSTN